MTYAPTHPRHTDSAPAPGAVMEGRGAYNKHATIPADGSRSAISHLRNAARAVFAGPDEPIVIADYGSSEG